MTKTLPGLVGPVSRIKDTTDYDTLVRVHKLLYDNLPEQWRWRPGQYHLCRSPLRNDDGSCRTCGVQTIIDEGNQWHREPEIPPPDPTTDDGCFVAMLTAIQNFGLTVTFGSAGCILRRFTTQVGFSEYGAPQAALLAALDALAKEKEKEK